MTHDSPAAMGTAPTVPLHPLEQLCAETARDHAPPELVGVLDHISKQVRSVMAEHAGMAEELLAIYEQLGIVFEVTRRLPELRNEHEVIDLFLRNLRSTFSRCTISTATCDEAGVWMLEEPRRPAAAWLNDLLDDAQSARSTQARLVPAGSGTETVEALAGPLSVRGVLVCAVVLERRADSREFQASEMLLIDSLLTFCGDLISNHRLLQELRELSVSTIRALVSAVDQKDPYTSGHSVRVGFYATELGRRIGLTGEDLQMLQWSALLHDVGKIGIRDEVLKKEGKLTEAEFEHIKEHPVRSFQVVRQIPPLAKALDGALYHHEKFNGRGYPEGLSGQQIPLQARIIQVADIFDALTSNRSYRAAFGWQKALAILAEECGTTVDPVLGAAFQPLLTELIGDEPDGFAKLTARAEQFASNTDSLLQPVGGS
jgi:GAF domain-containing protein